jgi:preprotein translocase subunit SecA
LLFLDSLQDEVQMIGKVRGDPLTHYNQSLIDGFNRLEDKIRSTILDIFDSLIIKDGKIDLDETGVRGPTSTRTYLVHDGTEDLSPLGVLGGFAAAFSAPLFILNAILQRLKKK